MPMRTTSGSLPGMPRAMTATRSPGKKPISASCESQSGACSAAVTWRTVNGRPTGAVARVRPAAVTAEAVPVALAAPEGRAALAAAKVRPESMKAVTVSKNAERCRVCAVNRQTTTLNDNHSHVMPCVAAGDWPPAVFCAPRHPRGQRPRVVIPGWAGWPESWPAPARAATSRQSRQCQIRLMLPASTPHMQRWAPGTNRPGSTHPQ